MSFRDLRDRARELTAIHARIQAFVEEAKKDLEEAEESHSQWLEAQALIQEVAQRVQQQAHDRIASVVTHCLRAVFEDPYDFRIDFERKRGRTHAVLSLYRGGHSVDPLGGAGGGVVDVAAFALRVACLMLVKPPADKVLVLDEPLKNIHGEENRARAAAMVQGIAKDLGVQIIMCTGLEWLKCGKVVEL